MEQFEASGRQAEKVNQQIKISQQIGEQCMSCGQCMDQCYLLQEIGELPAELAGRTLSCEEAYSCSQCRLCEAVCPLSLPVSNLFLAARNAAVEEARINVDDYRYLCPDRSGNLMSLFREYCHSDYRECPVDQEGKTAFFPGCTFLTYAPRLTKATFNILRTRYPDLTLLSDCCGLPLRQLGMEERYHAFVRNLKSKLEKLRVQTLIVVCPNCYYQLRPVLKAIQVKLITVYEALQQIDDFNRFQAPGAGMLVTVHDSCPDRFEQIFAAQVRGTLRQKGFALAEMKHHLDTTICCGSGGQVSHFRPEQTERLRKACRREAEESGADLLVGYCLSCVLNFAAVEHGIKSWHVLNLLLGIDEDYAGLKAKAQAMFTGEEGEKYRRRMMGTDQ